MKSASSTDGTAKEMSAKEMLSEAAALFAKSNTPAGQEVCLLALAEIEKLERALEVCRAVTTICCEKRVDGPNSGQVEIESLKVTLGCCLALMSQSGSESCMAMARRIPFTIKNGEPYALFSAPCATGSETSKEKA